MGIWAVGQHLMAEAPISRQYVTNVSSPLRNALSTAIRHCRKSEPRRNAPNRDRRGYRRVLAGVELFRVADRVTYGHNVRLSVSGRGTPVPTAQRKTIPEKERRGGPTFGCDIAPPTAALVPQWVYAVSTPVSARSNESVAKSDAGWITVTNARESVQASRGGGANDAGIGIGHLP